MCLGRVSRYVLESPVPSADLIALSPGYRVPPDLATVPYALGIRGLCSWRPQYRIECLKRRCRLRDVKRITASCRNDVMIPYKRSRLVGNAVLWPPTANRTVSHLCPTVCSPGTIPEALTVSLNKAVF